MSDFSEDFGKLIAADDRIGIRKLIEEMEGKVDTCTPEECAILKRRIRVLKDYLKDDEQSEMDI